MDAQELPESDRKPFPGIWPPAPREPSVEAQRFAVVDATTISLLRKTFAWLTICAIALTTAYGAISAVDLWHMVRAQFDVMSVARTAHEALDYAIDPSLYVVNVVLALWLFSTLANAAHVRRSQGARAAVIRTILANVPYVRLIATYPIYMALWRDMGPIPPSAGRRLRIPIGLIVGMYILASVAFSAVYWAFFFVLRHASCRAYDMDSAIDILLRQALAVVADATLLAYVNRVTNAHLRWPSARPVEDAGIPGAAPAPSAAVP